MKHHYIILFLLIVATAMMIFKMNRHAVDEHPGAVELPHNNSSDCNSMDDGKNDAIASIRNVRGDKPVFDKDKFIADVQNLVTSPQSANADPERQALRFIFNNSDRIASASTAQLKDACIKLEQAGPSTINKDVRYALLMTIIRSDPEWGITNLERMFEADAGQTPITSLINALGKHGQVGHANWNPAYAAALDKWLNQNVANGRVDGDQAEVATMRFDLAVTSGDLDRALTHLNNIPNDQLLESLESLASGIQGTAQCRQTMEKIADLTESENLRTFSTALAVNTGYDVAREALESAKLTPEGHDFAAAGIAAAEIGPQTASRADWLIRSLQSENVAAVTRFTASWTQASHEDAAAWITSLPAGKVRDAATAGYAPLAANLDGAAAAEWARLISEPGLRDSTFEAVIQTWNKNEPEAATSYLQRMKQSE